MNINYVEGNASPTTLLIRQQLPLMVPAIDFVAYRHPDNKFDVSSHKVINAVYASDHRPVSAVIDLIEQ